MSRAGNFQLDVGAPYPCWCDLAYGDTVIRFSHTELSDLKYAVEKAMQEAKWNLGKEYADEV